MNNRTKNAARIAMLGLLFGWFCTGCSTGVAVPSDCQRFLDQFFQAVKSNDVGKLQELSFPESVMDSAKFHKRSRTGCATTIGRWIRLNLKR